MAIELLTVVFIFSSGSTDFSGMIDDDAIRRKGVTLGIHENLRSG